METLKEMEKRHDEELQKLHEGCLHNEVDILAWRSLDKSASKINIRCKLCGAPIIMWQGDTTAKGEVLFARGFKKIEED